MKSCRPFRQSDRQPSLLLLLLLLLAIGLGGGSGPAVAATALVDQPINPRLSMPANVLLSLSVEYPTGNVQAHNDETDGTGCPGRSTEGSVCYFEPSVRAARVNAANAANPLHLPKASMPYIGYFDPFKCYTYDTAAGYFQPVGYTSGFSPAHHYSAQPAGSTAGCSLQWSGNFLNWATMQTIDMFRWAMTGGDRQIDTPTLTVLQKGRHDGQEAGANRLFPVKIVGESHYDIPVVAPSTVSPYSTPALFLRVYGLNTAVEVSTSASFASPVTMNVGVQVCNPALPETITTCTVYGSSSKPTGLVQENAETVRFSAFGYLLDDSYLRDGGVMRARMKFVGPQRPVLSAVGATTNANAEWRAADGVYIQNPDPADAAATSAMVAGNTISRSGVIQYLNRFGRSDGYKRYDPVAELFYEGLRYYRNLPPTPEYANLAVTTGTGARKIDGYPVIQSWDDPLAPPPGFESASEWCPKNFIIGIADANTHRDKRLPGNTATTDEAAATPSNADSAYNVSTLLSELLASEVSNEGVTVPMPYSAVPLAPGEVNSSNRNSAYPAALAYYANTRDIRPDAAAIQTHGRQTVKTFYADVRETGWGSGVPRTDPRRRNQLWLAGKYGGFTDRNENMRLDVGDAIADVNGDGVIDILDVWDGNGDRLPDSYFEVSSADSLVDGLKSAFTAIKSEIASNVTAAISTRSIELQVGNALYQVNFDPGYWAGDLAAYRYSGFDAATGQVSAAQVWSAAAKLAATDWSARRIATSSRPSASGTWGGGIPFRWTDLTAWQRTALNENEAVLEFLRGRGDDPSFRRRLRASASGTVLSATKLGDIVDSAPRFVGKPAVALSEEHNPGYAAHVSAREHRRPMIYVGANDGMLHGFDADIDGTDGGNELFAYVPSALFAGVTAPARDGLLALSDRAYLHRYYVNASPTVAEVDFARTNGATATGDWRTVLVGGLGKGGRAYYALDVTDPAAITSETTLADKVLWEFTDPTMGFSYGEPQIVKTRRWGWVALLTSGYNNIAANGSTGAGLGYLYIVDIRTGALLQRISTGSGTEASPAGLAQVTAYSPNAADGTVTEVYGGDLNGRVWRFDLTSATSDVPAPLQFATLVGPDGPQRVTSAPIVRAAPLTRNRYVFIGTGSMLGQRDLFDTYRQTFYALRDGTRIARWESGVAGAPTFPITRARMLANTNLLNPVTPDPTRVGGWYHDLTVAAERIVLDPQDTDLGKISWLGSAPNSTQLCTGQPISRFYLANFETGQSQLHDPATIGTSAPTLITAFDPGSSAVGLRLVRVGGNLRGLVSGRDQSLTLTQNYLRMLTPRTLNWREVAEPGL